MKEVIKYPIIIFVGGLIMTVGVYISRGYSIGYPILLVGLIVFIYGLYKDVK